MSCGRPPSTPICSLPATSSFWCCWPGGSCRPDASPFARGAELGLHRRLVPGLLEPARGDDKPGWILPKSSWQLPHGPTSFQELRIQFSTGLALPRLSNPSAGQPLRTEVCLPLKSGFGRVTTPGEADHRLRAGQFSAGMVLRALSHSPARPPDGPYALGSSNFRVGAAAFPIPFPGILADKVSSARRGRLGPFRARHRWDSGRSGAVLRPQPEFCRPGAGRCKSGRLSCCKG